MKVVLVLLFVMLAAATAFAYTNLTVTSSMTSMAVEVARSTSEPAALLLSGSALLGLAGAVKRLTV